MGEILSKGNGSKGEVLEGIKAKIIRKDDLTGQLHIQCPECFAGKTVRIDDKSTVCDICKKTLLIPTDQ